MSCCSMAAGEKGRVLSLGHGEDACMIVGFLCVRESMA